MEKAAWYIFPALVGHYLAFFGGIMFMLCYYIWFHPTGIEMPFFKFLKRSKGGAGVAAAAGGGVMGAGGDTTMTDSSATVPERMPLTFFKVILHVASTCVIKGIKELEVFEHHK